MFETFRKAWKIEDLRKRLLFTLLILVLFRLGCAIPVPYISAGALTSMFAGGTGDMLEYLNMMSGGALSECTLFALGVQPAINASIIMQLLAVAIPYLENLTKEGEEGQRKMRRITNYVGAGIGLMLSIGYYFIIRNMGALSYTEGFAGIFSAVVIVLAFTAGSQLCAWMGNQIDSKGIGNGISLMIFAGIVARWSSIYTATTNILARAQNGEPFFYIMLPLLLVLALVAVVFVVVLTNAERRIPVQYAKRVMGRKMYGGQASYIPIKVNMTGVMPIIFASTLCSLPGLIFRFINLDAASHPALYAFFSVFNYNSVLYLIVYVLQLLLCCDPVQPRGHCQPASQKQRYHSRHPSGQAHQRFYHEDPVQDHSDRRDLPGYRGWLPHHPRQHHRHFHPAWWYYAADRRGCGT